MAKSATPPHEAEPDEVPETDAQRRQRAVDEEQAALRAAEAAVAHMPQGSGTLNRLTAADVLQEGERMIKMLFPQPVTLTLPGYRMVYFPAGIQDVPATLADEPYLLASGATAVR